MKKRCVLMLTMVALFCCSFSISFAQQKYVVEKGDTLSLISSKFYGNGLKWRKIYNANSDLLENPNRLEIGMELIIPDLSAPEPAKAKPAEAKPVAAEQKVTQPEPVAEKPAPAPVQKEVAPAAVQKESMPLESRQQLIAMGDKFNYRWQVACERDFPPYNYVDDNGRRIGLDTELVTAVMAYLDIDFNIVNYPWNRVVHSVDTNEVDFAYQFVGKPERFEKYWMIGPLRSGITLFTVRKDSKIKDYKTLKDLTPYTIGHVMGYAYTDEFDSANYLKKQETRDNDLLIQVLVKGRTDMIIGDLNTLSYTAKKDGVYDQIRFLPTILKEVPRYIAFPKERKRQAELFEKGLQAIKNNGTYDKIMKKWK